MIATLSVKPDAGVLVQCSDCYDQRHELKGRGFAWNPTSKTWDAFYDADPDWPTDFLNKAYGMAEDLWWLHFDLKAQFVAQGDLLEDAVSALRRDWEDEAPRWTGGDWTLIWSNG